TRAWEEIKMTISKALLHAAVVLVIAMPATARAQCSYRMNDVGRPHAYLSGPCNGAAQGYSGAYPSRAAAGARTLTYRDRSGNFHYSGVSHGDGTGTAANGNRNVRTGNTVRTYDSSGRLVSYGHWRGNVFKMYDPNGRHVGTGYHNTRRMYDARGRYVGTATYSAGPAVR
ncbi:MAG TPA: hypothetical protein VE758_05835, partial [Chthoniobacterales bacterium]|nr:hypothetical protein [Chthoniobacterales bacterium]